MGERQLRAAPDKGPEIETESLSYSDLKRRRLPAQALPPLGRLTVQYVWRLTEGRGFLVFSLAVQL
jgi:hypothetical protein